MYKIRQVLACPHGANANTLLRKRSINQSKGLLTFGETDMSSTVALPCISDSTLVARGPFPMQDVLLDTEGSLQLSDRSLLLAGIQPM